MFCCTYRQRINVQAIVWLWLCMGIFAWAAWPAPVYADDSRTLTQPSLQNDVVRAMHLERDLETWVGQLGSPMMVSPDIMDEMERQLLQILEEAEEAYLDAYTPQGRALTMQVQMRVLHNLTLAASAMDRRGPRVQRLMQMHRKADELEATGAEGSAFAAEYWRTIVGLIEIDQQKDGSAMQRQVQSIQLLEALVRAYHAQPRGSFDAAYQDSILRLLNLKLHFGITQADIQRLFEAFPPGRRIPSHYVETIEALTWYARLFGVTRDSFKQEGNSKQPTNESPPVQPGTPLLLYFGEKIPVEADAQVVQSETADHATDEMDETLAYERTPVPKRLQPLVDRGMTIVQCPLDEQQTQILFHGTSNPVRWIHSSQIKVYGSAYQAVRNRLFDPPSLFVRMGALGEPPVWPVWLWVNEAGNVVAAGPRPVVIQ